MTPREPDRYDKIARDIFAQWERTRNAYPRDIAAALRQAESEAMETAAQAFAESPATQHSGEAVAAILRYLKSPAAAPAAEPRDVATGTARETYAGIDFTLGTTPVAPSLLHRVLAALNAAGMGVILDREECRVIAAELRRYIAADPREKRIAELEAAIRWALGEEDEFPTRQPGEGAYWWRTELRRRAALADGGEGKT